MKNSIQNNISKKEFHKKQKQPQTLKSPEHPKMSKERKFLNAANVYKI